jgi:hypothetical protein
MFTKSFNSKIREYIIMQFSLHTFPHSNISMLKLTTNYLTSLFYLRGILFVKNISLALPDENIKAIKRQIKN